MKKALFLSFVFALIFALPAHADKSSKILRGGLGFLYPDHNSFNNPGQFPLAHGMALEAGYTRQNGSTNQSLTPSFVYGDGSFGIGAYYARSGTDLGTNAASTAGAGMGVTLLKDRITLGASFDRSLESTRLNDGTIGATLNFNGAQRKGAGVGIGFKTTVGSATTNTLSGNLSAGYSFRSNDNIEGGVKFNNLNDFSNFTPYVSGNIGSQYIYFGGIYSYEKAAEDHTAGARIGFILGRSVDLSALATYVLETGGASTYGATLRASF